MGIVLRKTIYLLGILFVASCQINSSPNAAKDVSRLGISQDSQVENLSFFLHTPSNLSSQRKYPLVVFLHGYGQDVSTSASPGLRNWVSEVVQAKYPCFVLAPQCPKGQKWVDTDWRLKAHTLPEKPTIWLEKATALILQTIKNYPIDTHRVYLTGLSMGGFGTWDLAMRNPHLFAALVPVCGGGDSTQAYRVAHIPTWIFHGAQDEVISVERSRSMVRSLRRVGANPLYTEYSTLKHNSWDSAYSNPALYTWLFSQHR
ncbi:MAG: PHB depolymerase family esterase [Bacteroidia bacterium]|nr:alpha/beta hydrolase-fold protein [Bacteroidia bacterium]MDW8157734.1 PHB depolymerase family esterase [Bacteroidia bacterium]